MTHRGEAAARPLSEREGLARIVGEASIERRRHQDNAADRLMRPRELTAEQQHALWRQSKEPSDATRWRHAPWFAKATDLPAIHQRDLRAHHVLPVALYADASREYEAQPHRRHGESVVDIVRRMNQWLCHEMT